MKYELLKDVLVLAVVLLLFTFSRRTRFRVVIVTSGIISVAALYFWQAYEAPTTLVTIHAKGKITESYLGGGRKPDILFRIEDREALFRYKRWFPHFADIETQLRIGNEVELEYTIPSGDSSRAQIWQIASDGRILVTEKEIVRAIDANARYSLYLGVAFGIVALVLLGWDIRTGRREREDPHLVDQ